MFTFRLLRRRWVLGLIFLCSFSYFLISTFFWESSYKRDDYTIQRVIVRQPFQWHPRVEEHVNDTSTNTCRNSVQGKRIITDERGYTCDRRDILYSGCCDTDHTLTARYSCLTCQSGGCCIVYEYCVSCCLNNNKKLLLGRILREGQAALNPLYVHVRDHFELCLAKCRTSSQTVAQLVEHLSRKQKVPTLERVFNTKIRTATPNTNIAIVTLYRARTSVSVIT